MKTSWITMIVITLLVLGGLVVFFLVDWQQMNKNWYLFILDTEPKMLVAHQNGRELSDVWGVQVIPATKKASTTWAVYRLNKDVAGGSGINVADGHIIYVQSLNEASPLLVKIKEAVK